MLPSDLICFVETLLNGPFRKKVLAAILSDDHSTVMQMLKEVSANRKFRSRWFRAALMEDREYRDSIHLVPPIYSRLDLHLQCGFKPTDYIHASPLEIAIRAGKLKSLHVLCTEMYKLAVAETGLTYRKLDTLSWHTMLLASDICPESFDSYPDMMFRNVTIWNLLLLCLLREDYDAYRELVRAGFNEPEVNPYFGQVDECELVEVLPVFLRQIPEPLRELIGISGVTELSSAAMDFLRTRAMRANELKRWLSADGGLVSGSEAVNWRASILSLLEEKLFLDGDHVWLALSAGDPVVLARVFELGGPVNAGIEDEAILACMMEQMPQEIREVWLKVGAANWLKTDDLSASSETMARLLMHAFLRQAKLLVFGLLDKGASIDDSCHPQMNVPIRRLLNGEHLEWVGQWRQLCHPQAGDALLGAIHENDLAKVKALLPRSGDINALRYSARFGMQMTALSAALFCRLPASIEILELLLSAGAAASECDAEGIPAVIRAFSAVAPSGQVDADPLDLAFRRLDLLIKHGANPRQADGCGENLLHHAAVRFRATNPVEFGNVSLTADTEAQWQKLAMQSALLRLCVQYKLDPNAQDQSDNTIAHLLVLQLAKVGAERGDEIDRLLMPRSRIEDFVVTLGSLAFCDLTIKNAEGVLPFDMIDHGIWANATFKFAQMSGGTESTNVLMQMLSTDIFKRAFRAEPRLLMAMLQPFNIDDYSRIDTIFDHPGISIDWKLGVRRYDDVSEGWSKRAEEIRLVLEG